MAQPMSTGRDDVVEWGTDDESRRGGLAALSARLGIQDRHLVLTVAAAGAGLAGLSLLTHWQVTTMAQGRQNPVRLETGVAGLQAWGSGYLLGLLGLVALTAMTLYGAPVLRPHVRIGGLGWGAGLLGLLVALAASLTNTSVVIDGLLFGADPEYDVSYGPGLFLALAGVAALTTALHLSGRSGGAGAEPGSAGTEHAGTEHAGAGSAGTGRAAVRPAPPLPHAGPTDLTVSPATPFVHLPEHR